MMRVGSFPPFVAIAFLSACSASPPTPSAIASASVAPSTSAKASDEPPPFPSEVLVSDKVAADCSVLHLGGDWLYYQWSHGISRIPRDGGEPELVLDQPVKAFTADAKFVYIAQETGAVSQWSETSGGGRIAR